MKKLLFLGLLSIAAVSTSARDARAWFFDCCGNHCCNKYCTTLCVRPYNAFSPVAYGNIVADGCMPMNVYGGCAPRQQPCAPSCFGCPSYGPGCCTSGCCDVGCLPPPGSFASTQQVPMPSQMQMPLMQGQPVPQPVPSQQFVAPNPQIINPSSYMMPMPMQQMPQMQPMYGYAPPVQPVGYYPGYPPMYNPYNVPQAPVNYYPPAQAPGYWYGR